MMAAAPASARLFGKGDSHHPGIEAFGLSVRIEVGKWDMVVSASPVADDGWRGVPLDERLPDLVRALTLMMEIRAGGPRQEACSDAIHIRHTERRINDAYSPD